MKAIGRWGSTIGSFSFSIGLGLLLARSGRRWLVREGDYERALACYRLAHLLFKELGATDNAAQTLGDQGVAYHLIGEYTAALVAYERTGEAFAELMSSRPEIGLAAWQKAVLVADEICQIDQILQDANSLERNIERLQASHNRPSKLAGPDLFGEYFSDALRETITMRVEIALVMVPLYRALDARDAGKVDGAERYFEQALAAARTVSPDQQHFLEATVLRTWYRYPEAKEAFQRYLEQGGASSGFVGSLSERIAKRFGPAGQAVANQRPEQTGRFSATFLTKIEAYAEARRELDKLELLSGAEWWKQDARPWEALRCYGEVHEGLGELAKALTYYDQAIAEWEARWTLLTRDEMKIALASENSAQYLYFYATRAALRAKEHDSSNKQEYVTRAFDYSERGRARALLDLMATTFATSPLIYPIREVSTRLGIWRNLLAKERRQEHSDPQRITQLSQHIERDEAELRRLEAELTGSSDFLQGEVLSLQEASAYLPADSALLQYYFLGRDLLIWAITKQGMVVTHYANCDTKALSRTIRAFHRACEARGGLDRLGSELAQTLLAPLAEVIEEYTRLIIVPYGAAHVLPFHLLPWKGQPLAATHTISYLPSASSLRFLRSGNLGHLSGQILAVGNPARMSYQPPLGGEPQALSSLPASATEAAFVASLFQSDALIGKEATEPAVRERLATYSVLHFATHGHLSQEAPMLSSIMLADGEALTVYELMGLRLDADLVVLSACRTALGETTGGDDVLGLTRGLLAAGARAVVVSLWPVNDVSTSLLMGNFYEHLQKGDLPAVALQAAQTYLRTLTADGIKKELDRLKSTLQKANASPSAQHPVEQDRHSRHSRPSGSAKSASNYSHPYFWAPFILVG